MSLFWISKTWFDSVLVLAIKCCSNDCRKRPFVSAVYGCPADWKQYQKYCFSVAEQALDWVAARNACQQTQGADLAKITTANMQGFVNRNIIYIYINLSLKSYITLSLRIYIALSFKMYMVHISTLNVKQYVRSYATTPFMHVKSSDSFLRIISFFNFKGIIGNTVKLC